MPGSRADGKDCVNASEIGFAESEIGGTAVFNHVIGVCCFRNRKDRGISRKEAEGDLVAGGALPYGDLLKRAPAGHKKPNG